MFSPRRDPAEDIHRVITRRSLLKGLGTATVAVGAFGRALLPVDFEAIAAKPAKKTLYRLSPRYPCNRVGHGESARRRRGCAACNACKAHAKNKRFATLRAARRNRAHVACNCVAYPVTVRRRYYRRLFGFPGCKGQGRLVFDLRTDSFYVRCKEAT